MAKDGTGRAWRKRPPTILWMLSLGQLISWGLVYYTFPLFVVPMTQELGWSRSGMFGALSSAGANIQLFSNVPIEIVEILQGAVMIFAVARFTFRWRPLRAPA